MEIETLQINESGMKLLQMEKTRKKLGHVVKFTYAISGVNVLLSLSNDQSQKHITLRYTCFYLLGLIDTIYPI